MSDETSEVGDAIRELAHVVRTEDEIEGIALQVDDLWRRAQAQRKATADGWDLLLVAATQSAIAADEAAKLAQRAQIATQEPAGATQGGSGDSRASGGSCARCGAGIALPADDPENYEMAVCAPCEITLLKEGYQAARAQVEAIRAAIAREAAHGEAITRCNLVAERFQTVLDSVSAP